MYVSVPKEAKNVMHTLRYWGQHACTQITTKRQKRVELWASVGESCTHAPVRNKHTCTQTLTLLHPLTLSFTLTSPLFSPADIPPILPPFQKTHHHLPSCRKFLMISIISVRTVSPAKSKHLHAHTHYAQQAWK